MSEWCKHPFTYIEYTGLEIRGARSPGLPWIPLRLPQIFTLSPKMYWFLDTTLGQQHGLSQQGVWVPFWMPKPLKRNPQNTQNILCGISKNLNLKLIITFFHLLIIPLTLFNDVIPYFDKFIHVCGWNMSILWYPLKIWTPKNFTTANFRHPVSKSWLRHCTPPLGRFRRCSWVPWIFFYFRALKDIWFQPTGPVAQGVCWTSVLARN